MGIFSLSAWAMSWVEWIRMVQRKVKEAESVIGGVGQDAKAEIFDAAKNVGAVELELLAGLLDRDL